MTQQATFLASFPTIQSAIKISGDGGMRIQLDIPETQLGNAIEVLAWRLKVLKVTVEVASDDEIRTVGRRAAKRRVAESDTGM